MTTGVVMMNGQLQALPSSEVIMETGRVFDYEGKYLGAGSTEVTPAAIPSELADRLGQLACQAHALLGCYGYSRTDFLVDENGPVFIETNTLPGEGIGFNKNRSVFIYEEIGSRITITAQ